MANHLMVDIETLGLRPGSVITQIGYAVFVPADAPIVLSGVINVSIESSLQAGLTVDGGTIQWWMEQEPAARVGLFDPAPTDLADALRTLSLVQRFYQPKYVWANSPQFDIVTLETAFRAVSEKPFWHYRDVRDVRTIVGLAREAGWQLPQFRGVKHNAGEDAVNQVSWLIDAAGYLGVKLG